VLLPFLLSPPLLLSVSCLAAFSQQQHASTAGEMLLLSLLLPLLVLAMLMLMT
jgi:hypothetical protein